MESSLLELQSVVKYTQDYTTNASQDMIEVFPKLLEKREHPINFLEIGCFEGRTSRWIVENMFNHPEDKLYCVAHTTHLFSPGAAIGAPAAVTAR